MARGLLLATAILEYTTTLCEKMMCLALAVLETQITVQSCMHPITNRELLLEMCVANTVVLAPAGGGRTLQLLRARSVVVCVCVRERESMRVARTRELPHTIGGRPCRPP